MLEVTNLPLKPEIEVVAFIDDGGNGYGDDDGDYDLVKLSQFEVGRQLFLLAICFLFNVAF